MIVDTKDGFRKLIAPHLDSSNPFAIDYECVGGPSVLKHEIIVIGLSWGEEATFSLPVGARALFGDARQDLPLDWTLNRLFRVLTDVKIAKYAHNAKYEKHVTKNYGIDLRGEECSLVMGFFLDENKPNGLKVRCADVGMFLQDFKSVFGQCQKIHDADPLCEYCGLDALTCRKLGKVYQRQLKKIGLLKNYRKEMAVQNTFFRMERRGICVSASRLRKIDKKIVESMNSTESRIFKAVGHVFNLGSPKQLGVVLFDELGMPIVKATKTGAPSADASALEELEERTQHPTIADVGRYRKLSKQHGTYTGENGLRRHILDDGRIHTNFNGVGARTGRASSNDPNLQNIPAHGDEFGIRSAFVAKAEYCLLVADYSMVELRMIAHYSGDPIMCGAFRTGEDLHARTAKELGLPATKEGRRQGKTMNFALQYGMGEEKLSRVLRCPVEQAREYLRKYWMVYRRISQWQGELISRAKNNNGVIRLISGRLRRIPELFSTDFGTMKMGERMTVNSLIQGSCGDLIKDAMIRAEDDRKLKNLHCRLLLQVHDELVFECPRRSILRAVPTVRGIMEDTSAFSEIKLPFTVEIGHAASWSAAKS